jgi:hypothetical protein
MTKSKNKRQSKSGKNRTPIGCHTLDGKELQPPFSRLSSRWKLTSWKNDRLPEMIWAALIRASVDQDDAIAEFRRILSFIPKSPHKEALHDIRLSGIGKIDPDAQRAFISHILDSDVSSSALCALKMFTGLPARSVWLELLPDRPPDIELLMVAVGSTLWHQSEEATDCQWVRLMGQLLAGKLHVPREIAEEWLRYPYKGDQRSVRPRIRASEGTENPLVEPDLTWPQTFWDEAWRATPCFKITTEGKAGRELDVVVTTRSRVNEVHSALLGHWHNTHSTTAIDAKHDAMFGMAFYCLRLFNELLAVGNGTGLVGRLILRTLLEVRITLRYLLTNDDSEVWKKWRQYGAGQAKLNALKFDADVEPPTYINVESIEQIAGEDMWEEFLSINLGNWGGVNLRNMSEKAQLKQLYDQHYSWTSGYVHGTWGPVRETCFQTCGNPLHRLHRYPEAAPPLDTVADAADLIDQVLQEISAEYPRLGARLVQ